MDEPLTGRAAAEALGLCAQLGNSGARFDARRLGAALRSAAGRGRVRAGLTLAILVPHSRARSPRRRHLRRVLRAATSARSPGRPDRPGPPSPREAAS